MKLLKVLSYWLMLAFTLMAPATPSEQLSEKFLIDQSKPFAYIKFDHVADRKQPSPNESPKGLWLRLVNNCRLPIAVTANGPEPGEPGVTIEYDVIQDFISGFSGLRFPDPSSSSASTQIEAIPVESTEPPNGYSIEVGSILIIPPKGDLLFSVPLNAVSECRHINGPKAFSPCWHLQGPFHFQLAKARTVESPKILVDFGWQDLPKQIRESSRP
jgi:hypothetical protein